ncbi:hypothetical protein ACHQM5_022246 [Ranunculus cassubicifolius]
MNFEQMKKPPPGSPAGEVLHQRRNMPFCPLRMAAGGFLMFATIGYFTLYSKKKAEVSALEVAKVSANVTDSQTTRPH